MKFVSLFLFLTLGLCAQESESKASSKTALSVRPLQILQVYTGTAFEQLTKAGTALQEQYDKLSKEVGAGKISDETFDKTFGCWDEMVSQGIVYFTMVSAIKTVYDSFEGDLGMETKRQFKADMAKQIRASQAYDNLQKDALELLKKAADILDKQGTPIPSRLRNRMINGQLLGPPHPMGARPSNPQQYRGFFFWFEINLRVV